MRNGIPVVPMLVLICAGSFASLSAQGIAQTKPTVVELVPANGATNVDPSIREIRATFSVPMRPGFSWCGGGPNYPTIPQGQMARWSDDRKTCILPVELKGNWTYYLGLNAPSFRNFRSAQGGVPLEPVEYSFSTGPGGGALQAPAAEPAAADKPTVVELVPANGATNVDPSIREIRATFSVAMESGCSWCGGGPLFPTIPEGQMPRWTDDRKTCILPVQLRPNWKYRLGLNAPSFQSFRSAIGSIALEPVEYSFTTGAGGGPAGDAATTATQPSVAPTPQPADPNATSEMLDFNLDDAMGRRIASADYRGTPVFLEFGACW